ncbi:MAG: phosphatase [Leptolyngbyaceae cyanobacterium SL_7_1]|nr:phosphatase [Leptolyngbyaceae cyanobacterium SL_7_1]
MSDDFSAIGQVDDQTLQQAAQAGFQSVLNLRSPNENGTLDDEKTTAEAAGLHYANVPLSNTTPDLDQVHQALAAIEHLPKPVLIHCGAGLRASAIALLADANQANLSTEELTTKAEELEIPLDQPHLNQFIQATDDENPSS